MTEVLGDVAGEAVRPASPVLQVRVDPVSRVISLYGEVDCAATELPPIMTSLIAIHPGERTVNLREVTFLDAAGLGYLIAFGNQLTAIQARMILTGANDRVRRLFRITHLSVLLAG